LLKIDDPTTISVIDFNRLPQRPIYRSHVNVCCPVIIKLSNAADKRLIFSHLKNLKEHNAAKHERFLRPQYVTKHLPKKFQDKRRLLLPAFKKAREQNKITSWRAVNGHYALFVDNIRVELPEDDSSS